MGTCVPQSPSWSLDINLEPFHEGLPLRVSCFIPALLSGPWDDRTFDVNRKRCRFCGKAGSCKLPERRLLIPTLSGVSEGLRPKRTEGPGAQIHDGLVFAWRVRAKVCGRSRVVLYDFGDGVELEWGGQVSLGK